jgi:glucose/arabinose dehydrogenase
MSVSRASCAGFLAAIGSLALAASVGAAGPPPLPKAASGEPVQVVGTGVPTPTAFAFDGSTVFAGSGPNEQSNGPGGLFSLAGGTATKIPNTPAIVFGLAFRAGTLYVSTGSSIVALTGWNGTTFSASKTIYSGKKGFPGFNGLSFGPDGRLYAGLSLNQKYDHAKDPYPLSQAVVSMTSTGKKLKVVARGLRQPFQLTFPQGSAHPYVSVLGQDKGKIPLDEIVVAKSGQNYGFPTCTWLVASACKGFDKPLIFLPKHSSPMGISSIGTTLYVSLFGGTTGGKNPEVVTIPTKGGKPTPFLTGFVAPVIALGINAGNVYVGDLTGRIYEVGT